MGGIGDEGDEQDGAAIEEVSGNEAPPDEYEVSKLKILLECIGGNGPLGLKIVLIVPPSD
jgi:hypothetical protein